MSPPSPRRPQADDDIAWHALTPEAVLTHLDVAPGDGLDHPEVAARRAHHGPNRLAATARDGALRRLARQVHNVLIYVLIAAGALAATLGEPLDAAVIFGVVVINAAIGFVQESKADRALEAIRDMLAPHATVRRGGRRGRVPADDLVPGDIVLLTAGDRVPADLRLIACDALAIQEAALTGESLAVDKAPAALAAETPLAERQAMAYAGTLAVQGAGTGVVTATGAATELGRITGLVAGVERLETPLTRQLDHFGRGLTAAILAVAVLTGLVGVLVHAHAPVEMFLAGVALAVAAVPEGLPAVVTIALAIGVTRMARRNAIIRRLPAVETLGAVSVICTDKTGTLTQNRLAATLAVTAEGETPLDGAAGTARPDAVTRLLRAGLLCNDGAAERAGADWRLHGNPTDRAFLAAAIAAGFDPAAEGADRPRTALLPFDSAHKLMASRHGGGADDEAALYVKGAPEHVLARCATVRTDGGATPIDRDAWTARVAEMAGRGLRVLAVAEAPPGSPAHARDAFGEPGDVGETLSLLGLVGLMDPPRPEAARAVARCREAGIAVKMITGDHAATAAAIGAELGLDGGPAITGPELDRMDDAAFRAAATRHTVFARTTPEHKIRLVDALQAEHGIVAMTGDGVNDAAALKRADIGIAMGVNGTEAAKEAADMVLADDNFASITHAVEEGRTVYDNLMKAILFILPTSFGQAMMILGAVLAGGALPVTPPQILWVNMITAVTMAIAIAFEPAEPGLMARRPRAADAPILSRLVAWRTAFVGALMVAASYGLFHWALADGRSLEGARALAVSTLVLCECAYLLNSRRLTGQVFAPGRLTGNVWIWPAIAATIALQTAFTAWPPLQRLFGTAALTPGEWALGAGCALLLALAVEIERAVARRPVRP